MFSPGLTFPPRVGGVQLGPIPLSKGVGGTPAEPALLLETGDDLLLESGEPLLLEA